MILLMLAIFVGGLSMIWPQVLRRSALRRQVAELDRRIDEKTREIAALKENCRRFHSDGDFVEAIAREKHRVSPGELVFIFQDM